MKLLYCIYKSLIIVGEKLMYTVKDVSVRFSEGLLAVLRRKGVPESVLDEIRCSRDRDIKRIIVIDDEIQRDLLYWLDRNTTVILNRVRGKNIILKWIACLYIEEMELIRNIYICFLYRDRTVLLSPFPVVEKALLSKIQELEKEYATIRF